MELVAMPHSLENRMLGVYRRGAPPMVGRRAVGVGSGQLVGRRRFGELAYAIRYGLLRPMPLDDAQTGDRSLYAPLSNLLVRYRQVGEAEGFKAPDADEIKRLHIPAVTLSGVMRDGKRKDGFPYWHTGCYQGDADGLTRRDAERLRRRAAELPYVAMAFVSMSYGLKVVLRGQPAQDADDHDRQWRQAVGVLADDLGVELDLVVSSPGGLCFLSHDPGLYYNPDCMALPPAPPETVTSVTVSPPSVPPPAGNGVADIGQAALAAAHLQRTLLPTTSRTYLPEFLPSAASVYRLWGADACQRWIDGGPRPSLRAADFAAKAATRSELDATRQLCRLALSKGWQKPEPKGVRLVGRRHRRSHVQGKIV